MSEAKTADEGILVIAFVEENGADEALKALKDAKKEDKVHFWDAAVIRKDVKGHYHYKETKDSSAGKGASIGAVIGGVIGTLGGPAGVVLGIGAGAAIGGVTASGDTGFKDTNLEEIGHALQSGNSALVAVTSQDYLDAAREYAAEENVSAVLHKLSADISQNMVHGQNAAYVITTYGRTVSLHKADPDHEIIKAVGVSLAA